MYNGIVFNNMQEMAFLSIAANEGLISERGVSDGLFDRIKNSMPSYSTALKLLEKFCVAGKVYIDPFTYHCLGGELVERNIIVPYSNERTVLDGLIIEPYMIQQLLEEKGYDITYYSIESISKEIEEWEKKAKELLDFYEKHPKFQTDWLLVTMGLECESLTKKEKEYYTELEKEVFGNLIYKAVKECADLVDIAYRNNLLSPIRISTEINRLDYYSGTIPKKVLESESAIRISKYMSETLGRIYVAGSLKDCITLTQSNAAIAYRKKIDEFVTSVSRQDVDCIERINKEIVEAQAAMRWESGCEKVIEISGRICATAGVIGQTLSLMYPNTQVGQIGSGISIAATYIGVPLAFIPPLTQDQYLWASYGLIN